MSNVKNVQDISVMNKSVPEFLKRNKKFMEKYDQEVKDQENLRLKEEEFQRLCLKQKLYMQKNVLPLLLKLKIFTQTQRSYIHLTTQKL